MAASMTYTPTVTNMVGTLFVDPRRTISKYSDSPGFSVQGYCMRRNASEAGRWNARRIQSRFLRFPKLSTAKEWVENELREHTPTAEHVSVFNTLVDVTEAIKSVRANADLAAVQAKKLDAALLTAEGGNSEMAEMVHAARSGLDEAAALITAARTSLG